MTALIKQSTGIQRLDVALGVLGDSEATMDDRAAAYAFLYGAQITINRQLRSVKDDLIVHMEREGMRSMGPLSIKSSAVDPSYPCNAPDNWDDAGVQDAMTALLGDPSTRPYVRRIPSHLEIAVDVLAQDVQMGVQAAIDLYRELNRRGWRKEEARRLSLAVREQKPTREEPAA